MNKNFNVNGFCKPKFEKVKNIFEKNFNDGLEIGASCAVTINGEYVVDIWGGFMDEEKSKPWESDTIVNVWSSTKIMTSLCIHILVDRGLLDLEDPVVKYWPEFNKNGKDKILVKHFLRHSSGLYTWDVPFGRKDQCDWDKAISLLEEQKAKHQPGAHWIYHAVTFGFLLGHLVKKITGKSIGTFFQEEVAKPLDIDFYIGVPEEIDPRIAHLIPPEMEQGDLSYENFEKAKQDLDWSIKYTRKRQWRAAEVPGSNGHGNARSMARVGSLIACKGKLDGKRIISEQAIENAMQERIFRSEFFGDGDFKFGLGWLISEIETSKKTRIASWGGWGGSNISMDLENGICFTYAMNKMINSLTGDSRSEKLRKALYECL